MVQQRLPTVNGDDGAWGDILNQFLSKEHYNTGVDNAANGGHQNITIRAGSNAANTAPIIFTSGPLMTTAQAGAVEFLTDRLYFTQTTGTTRRAIATYLDGVGGATGDIYYRDSSGNFTRLPVGSSAQVLTVTTGLPAWQTLSGSINNLDGGVASTLFGGTATVDGGAA